jgi:hypothetical protein
LIDFFNNMGCSTIKNDGVRTNSQVVNIGVITRSRSLKGGS